MTEEIKKINTKVDEISSFFSLFKKGKIKEELNLILNDINTDLSKVQEFKDEITNLSNNYTSMQEDLTSKITTLTVKEKLISNLLSAKSNNKGLLLYKETLYNDFLDFANSEDALANEAEAILKLQSIEKELELITAYPTLYKKNIVAIGGGFSAGKSEFISCFINSEIKLPIGIEPTTAIPTYVINTDNKKLIACNQKGGAIDLNKIDNNFQEKLSHSFIKSFDFNLKEIMHLMVLGTEIDYEHICFIDTPGYNPSEVSDGYTNEDIGTAKEFLENADTFMWLIGADVNGTVPSSDLNFLSNLDLENKKLYVVLNKADLRSDTDLESILDEIVETLDDYDINVVGISAYSSINKKEYSFRKMPMNDFIDNSNIEARVHKSLVLKLYDVYNMYKKALFTAIKEKKSVKAQLKSIALDLLEEGYEDTTTITLRLDNLNNFFTTKEEELHLKNLEDVTKKLKFAIDNVFEYESDINPKEILDDEIELEFDFNIQKELDSLEENLDNI